MPARRQKRPEDLQGYGSRYRGTTTLQLVAPDASQPVPRMPKNLSPHLRPYWRAFWSDPISSRLTAADMYHVGHYFGLLAERDEMLEKAREKPLVPGSMDNEVLNHLYKRVAELTTEIKDFNEKLGILPLSRSRLGWETAREASGFLDLMRKAEERRTDEPTVIDLDEIS
jgi:hypothetical protein